jgi:hypothetical protein
VFTFGAEEEIAQAEQFPYQNMWVGASAPTGDPGIKAYRLTAFPANSSGKRLNFNIGAEAATYIFCLIADSERSSPFILTQITINDRLLLFGNRNNMIQLPSFNKKDLLRLDFRKDS